MSGRTKLREWEGTLSVQLDQEGLCLRRFVLGLWLCPFINPHGKFDGPISQLEMKINPISTASRRTRPTKGRVRPEDASSEKAADGSEHRRAVDLYIGNPKYRVTQDSGSSPKPYFRVVRRSAEKCVLSTALEGAYPQIGALQRCLYKGGVNAQE